MADLEPLQVIIGDSEVVKYLPEDTMTIGEVQDILTWLIDCYVKNRPERILKFTVAVALKKEGSLIGWCGLGPLEFAPAEIELYYGLAKKYWGKGYATEAGAAILDYGFNTIGLNKIVAVVNPENSASVKVLEKLGMVFSHYVSKLPYSLRFYEGDRLYSLSETGFNS
jgi:[ribosomal protein S5]-alanine N-acetyltransferase